MIGLHSTPQPGARSSGNNSRVKFHFVLGITLVRVPLIFLFLSVSVFSGHPPSAGYFLIAFVAMILSAVTDIFDGYLARRFKVASRLGSYADPMMDKIFYLTTFPALVYFAARNGQYGHAQILLLLAIVFLLRDQWVTFLRSLGALHNMSAAANWSGKARTIISFPTICLIYYHLHAPRTWPWQIPVSLAYVLEAMGFAINLISIYVYTRAYWPALRAELRPPEQP